MSASLSGKVIAGALLICLVCVAGPAAAAQSGRTYATPQDAVKALIAAVKAENDQALYAVLGPDSKQLLESGDATADRASREDFIAAYERKNTLVADEGNKSRMRLVIGEQNWALPIPLVSSKGGRWSFDTKAGAEALLDRRIGHNELSAIQVCLAYVDAQKEYHALNPDRAAVPHYAKVLASRPGKRDGLYWKTEPGEVRSPLGALAATAEAGGYAPARQGQNESFFGYHYRVLSKQGKHASGGERDYVEKGLMSGGFALLAYPARYGASGVMTFIVNQDGVIYEKNLGKNTPSVVRSITAFDPDTSWQTVGADAL